MTNIEKITSKIYIINMKQTLIRTIVLLSVTIFCGTIICGCSKSIRYDFNKNQASVNLRYPDASFAVISDIHIYSPELGSSGSAFEKVLHSDRKLLLSSIELLEFAINEIIASGVNFVLIPGDLTKDGELVNHRIAAEKLNALTAAGIAVYVIPGNHDVNNPDAFRFTGDGVEPVATITADDFAQIYGNFGYNAAIMRDSNSLSYAAEPVPGLWLLAIDANRYRENVPEKHPHVSGRINQKTADWIAEVGREAARQNKAVMAMMHHGFVESWKGKAKLHPEYLINDFANFTRFLSSWNIRFGFSGHYHAHDVTGVEFNDTYFYDIATGSLVTSPCPLRYIQIKNNALDIRSDFIVERLHPGTDFARNADAFVKATVKLEAASVLRKFRVREYDIELITDAVGDAFAEHYRGNEDPLLSPLIVRSWLSPWGRFVLKQQQYVIDGLWQDLEPLDHNITIYLF